MSSPDRREFLERLALGAVAAAGLVAGTPEASVAASSDPAQPTEKWDLTWTERVKGAHRAVFDATEIESGAGLLRAMVWKRQFAEVLGVGPDDLFAVVVIRHSAIPLAMTQEFWDKYQIGKRKKVTHPFTEKPMSRNPALMSVEGGDLSPEMASLNLAGFLKGGGVALACNLAFADCVATIAKEDKVDQAEARKRALAMLNPGIVLQPSGVFATIRAQELGCQYLKAS